MHTVDSWKDIPDSVPVDVRNTIDVADRLLDGITEVYKPGTTSGFVAQFRRKSSEIGLGIRDIPVPKGTYRTIDLLNLLLATTTQPHRFPGKHVGIALISEMISRMPANTEPGALADAFVDSVEHGAHVDQVALGVMSSGWRYLARRSPGTDHSTITLLSPSERWPEPSCDGEVPVLAEVLAKLNVLYHELG